MNIGDWVQRELAAIRERARTGDETNHQEAHIMAIADRLVLLEYVHDLEARLADRP